jgi:hypothetical protein
MKSAKEIAEELYYHQDSMEAVVRAINLPQAEFVVWGKKNPLLVSYALGRCEIPLPILIQEEIHDEGIDTRILSIFLYDYLSEKEIKKQFNEYFTRHKN